MSGVGLVVGIAVLTGVMVALQSQMLGALDARIGTLAAGSLTFLSGGLVGLVLLVLLRPDLSAWRTVPWWAWLGGVAGLILVSGLAFAVPRIGITPTLTIIIGAQLAVAVVLEHYGWLGALQRSVDLTRLAGLALVALGAWLVIR